jgi:hypothetical protein
MSNGVGGYYMVAYLLLCRTLKAIGVYEPIDLDSVQYAHRLCDDNGGVREIEVDGTFIWQESSDYDVTCLNGALFPDVVLTKKEGE